MIVCLLSLVSSLSIVAHDVPDNRRGDGDITVIRGGTNGDKTPQSN